MGAYLKSTVHCINGARSKLLGPDTLLHVNIEVLAEKGTDFLPGADDVLKQ